MLKRCVMIFPEFENIQVIDKIRDKYDPLVNNVRPHITLVFPFESNIETEALKTHISTAVSEFSRFNIVLSQFTPDDTFGRYLFLNVHEGIEVIKKLHKKIYTGILKEYYPDWLSEDVYLPHITVGKFGSDEELAKAAADVKNIDDEFKTIVNKISVEIIDENEDSIIEVEVPLK